MKYIKSINEDFRHINVSFGKGKSAIGQLYEYENRYFICDVPLEDKFIEISKELYEHIKK